MTDGACADISEHKAWLLEDDKVVYGPVPMLPGGAEGTGESSDGTATPTGTFTVTKKAKNYWSKEFDAPMPNSVFFYPGVAFHTGSLVKYSHGCIHLSAEAAEKVFDTLEVGDPVQVVP
ncbi:L,D-transpeptidase [Amycolatopsis keratiniphila subsp. nogabecina]|nr:L,D-transpeptidase [Amycolatopsis keratiniphila subsp. nogabecina]